MKRWTKALLAGLTLGGAAYGIDAGLVSKDEDDPKRRFGMAAIPAAIVGVSAAAVTWLVSRPEPGEDFPEELGYYTWPPSYLPQWPWIENWSTWPQPMPPGTVGYTKPR